MSTVFPSSFTTSLLASFDRESEHKRLLARYFGVPVSCITKTAKELDKQGADYLVALQNGVSVSVDMKDRSKGAQRFWRGPEDPDIAIELVSHLERKLPGSMVADSPFPDVFAFRFADLPGHLFTLAARPLRRVTRKHMDRWLREYGLRTNVTLDDTGTGTYHSHYVFVPWSVVSPLVQQDALNAAVSGYFLSEQE